MSNNTNKKADEFREFSKKTIVRDEEFRIVAEDAPVMLWLTNTEGAIIFTNARWKRFVGAGSSEFVSGKQWVESLHPDDRDHCLQTFQNAFATHQSFQMEYRLRRNDGKYRYIHDTGEPYINKQGKFSGFIGSSADITDRKNNETQLLRSERELTQYNQEMRLINDLNSYLQVCQTFEETYSIVGHYAKQIFADSAGALYLFNEDRTAVEIVSRWGNFAYEPPAVISPGECWALRQSREHIVGEDTQDKIKCEHVLICPQQGYICTPAIAQGEMIGFLYAEFGPVRKGPASDVPSRSLESRNRLITIAADNLAMALVSLKLREALRIQSVRDPLTLLFNRRYMEETLRREIARCKRTGTELGIIMFDVDHFKKYNDTYGHDAGDVVLKQVAEITQARLRQTDVACRYGGEEFILLLPGVPGVNAIKRAEQLREIIQQQKITHKDTLLPTITVSVGVAIYPEHGDSSTSLLKAADMALYQAKDTGRNRVIVAENELLSVVSSQKRQVAN